MDDSVISVIREPMPKASIVWKAMFSYLMAIWFLVGCAAAVAVAGSPEAEKHLAKGRAALERERFTDAIEAFSKARDALSGRSYEALIGLARAHVSLGNPKEAAEAAHAALLETDDATAKAEASLLIGRAFLECPPDRFVTPLDNEEGWRQERREYLRQAETWFRQAIATAGDTVPEAQFQLGHLLGELGRFDEAISAMERFLSLESATPLARAGGLMLEAWRQVPEDVRTLGEEARERYELPEKISAPQPQYSPVARAARVQGTVVVIALIDEQGRVAKVEVLKGLPMKLTEEAVAAVQRWTFEPARLDGRAISYAYTVTVSFRLF